MIFKMKMRVTDQELKTRRVPIACDCWFSVSGRTIPRFFVYEDEEGIRHTVQDIRILHSERRRHDGIPAIVYDCMVTIEGVRGQLQLYHFLEEAKWEIEVPE